MSASDVCGEVGRLLDERQNVHGDFVWNLQNIAALWTVYLGRPITATHVAVLMNLLKVARTMGGSFNRDDFIDMTGYAAGAAELAERGL